MVCCVEMLSSHWRLCVCLQAEVLSLKEQLASQLLAASGLAAQAAAATRAAEESAVQLEAARAENLRLTHDLALARAAPPAAGQQVCRGAVSCGVACLHVYMFTSRRAVSVPWRAVVVRHGHINGMRSPPLLWMLWIMHCIFGCYPCTAAGIGNPTAGTQRQPAMLVWFLVLVGHTLLHATCWLLPWRQ